MEDMLIVQNSWQATHLRSGSCIVQTHWQRVNNYCVRNCSNERSPFLQEADWRKSRLSINSQQALHKRFKSARILKHQITPTVSEPIHQCHYMILGGDQKL
ncbi:hypothetical protein RRG08_025766 [Elysia crispata]|uniref:Uncharacterized protein n=1 Tax=Elysia crispata TaxID=231223 RepID=A0AAE1AGG5_9GAST|nr:hypothetical protein RRG08_025766 [Elysia crispata]